MQPKVFLIVPSNNYNTFKDVLEIINTHLDLNVSQIYTNDSEYEDTANNKGFYYLDNNTIVTSIKNNSILYTGIYDNYLYGVTIDEFYNGDVIPMFIYNFNDISTNFIDKYSDSIVIAWCDTQSHNDTKLLKREINEASLLMDKINTYNLKFLYFLDEDFNTVTSVLNDYINGEDETRLDIEEKYS